MELAAALRARLVAVSVVDGLRAEEPLLAGPGSPGDQLAAVRAVQTHVRTLAGRAGVGAGGAHGPRPSGRRAAATRPASCTPTSWWSAGSTGPGVRLTHVGRTAEQVLEFCEVPVLVVPASRDWPT